MVIRADDAVAKVLRRDPSLVETFVRASPAFARLRNPLMRSTMARLVTVEQAARIAGLEPSDLLARLNAAANVPDERGHGRSSSYHAPNTEMPNATTRMPEHLAAAEGDRIVDVDVRDDLRAGREPFARIMAARRALGSDQVLRLRAIFEPVPLYGVMARQGLEHWSEQLGPDDWRVWFWPAGEAVAEPREPIGCDACGPVDRTEDVGSGVQVLDVRDLDPPEPMMRTLNALRELPPGGTLVQLNVRFPRFLIPHLEKEGYRWEVREQSDEVVRLFITRSDEGSEPAA
jgi:uncharacterized protein (DUF2249 family)